MKRRKRPEVFWFVPHSVPHDKELRRKTTTKDNVTCAVNLYFRKTFEALLFLDGKNIFLCLRQACERSQIRHFYLIF